MNIHACVDCIHIITKPHVPVQNSRCGHEFDIDLVTGERLYKFCELSRKYGPCNAEGKYFEPKQDPRYQERDDHDGEPIINGRPF